MPRGPSCPACVLGRDDCSLQLLPGHGEAFSSLSFVFQQVVPIIARRGGGSGCTDMCHMILQPRVPCPGAAEKLYYLCSLQSFLVILQSPGPKRWNSSQSQDSSFGQVPYSLGTSGSSSVTWSQFYLTHGTAVRCGIMTYSQASARVQDRDSVLVLFLSW